MESPKLLTSVVKSKHRTYSFESPHVSLNRNMLICYFLRTTTTTKMNNRVIVVIVNLGIETIAKAHVSL